MADDATSTPAAERGRLEIRERVYTRVASMAAREVPDVVRVSGTLDAVTGRELPRVHAHVTGERVRLQVEVALRWPAPLADRAAAVRERVTERVRVLTGADVDLVDVTVARVVVPDTGSDDRETRRVL